VVSAVVVAGWVVMVWGGGGGGDGGGGGSGGDGCVYGMGRPEQALAVGLSQGEGWENQK